MKEVPTNSLGRKKRKKVHDCYIVLKVNKGLKIRFFKYAENKGETATNILRRYIRRVSRNVRG